MRPQLLIFILLLCTNAEADHLPRWELGASIGSLSLPAYRASKENSSYTLPLPYISYRGERLQIGRDGIKGFLYDGEIIDIDISAFGSPPVNSSDISARQGMEDLAPTLELGPSLTALLYLSPHQKDLIKLKLPLRSVISTDLHRSDHHGWILYPHLELSHQNPPHGDHWKMSLSIGPLFANSAYHDYFFGVDDNEATAQRPSYQGSSGYSGNRTLFSYRRYLTDNWVFRGFIYYENLGGAAFSDSPLATANETFAGGFLISYIFKRSSDWGTEH